MERNDLSTSTPASEVSSDMVVPRDDGNSEESALMADILRNSPAKDFLNLPSEEEEETSEEEVTEESLPVESEETQEEEESVSETDEEEEEPSEEEEEVDAPSDEDIDWGYKIPVKIDGKLTHVTLEEVRKGYATDQHLSQKGRELGELKKQIEAERDTKLNEIVQLGTVLHEELTASEAVYANQYTELKGKIAKAKEENDTYTARELKEELETVQEKYWEVRNKREERTRAIAEKIQAKQAEEQQRLLANFQEQIKEQLPEFDDKLAKNIRDFALKEGIPEELLNQVYDARVVRVLNDYRKLKLAKETGVAKRKTVPVVKATPAKKGPSLETKEKRAQESLRNKVFQGNASKEDENAFLKSISKVGHKFQ